MEKADLQDVIDNVKELSYYVFEIANSDVIFDD